MIWSSHRRLCFVHIPKTGGTSITAAYEPHMRFDDVVLGGTALGEALQARYRTRFGLHKHSGVRAIRQAAGAETYDATFSFALIRHPVDRMISLYRWLRGSPTSSHALREAAATLDLDAFVSTVSDRFTSQAAHVKADGRIAVTRLYRFDDLPRAWDEVARHLGVESVLGHSNPSRSQRVEASAAARATIETVFAEDLDLYHAIKPLPA
jgi:hypothetical protein